MGQYTPSWKGRSFERMTSAMRRMSEPKLSRYSIILKIANSISDHAEGPKPTTTVRISSPLVQKYNFNSFKQLIDIDTKYKNAELVLVSENFSRDDMVIKTYGDVSKLLNNTLRKGYEGLRTAKDLTSDKEPVQIFYSEIFNGYRKKIVGNEVTAPSLYKIKTKIAGEPLEITIYSLAIFPNIKGLYISKKHPRYPELIDKKADLPIVGEVPFIKNPDSENLDIAALTPSYVLEHSSLFPDEKPELFGKFKHPESSDLITSDEMAKYVSQKLNVPEQLINITPYIIEKYVENGKPITKIVNGEEVIITEKPEHSIKFCERTNINHTESLQLMAMYALKARSNRAKSLQITFSDLDFARYFNLLHDGQSLVSKKKSMVHYNRISQDILRGLLLSQNEISDADISVEYQIIDLLSCCLQNHSLTNDFSFEFNGLEYSRTIKELLSSQNVSPLTPWDRIILKEFFSIESKQDFNNFILKLATYQIICGYEPSQKQDRINLKFHLMSNILLRLLNNFGKYYYPSLSKYADKVLRYNKIVFDDKQNESLTFLPGPEVKTNEFTHYIKYPIEEFETSKDDEVIFKLVFEMLNAPRFGPFYALNKVIFTKNEAILKNFKLLQNLNPDGQLKINDINSNFNSNHVLDKIVDLGDGNGTIIFYRNLHREETITPIISKKLTFIDFKVSARASKEHLERKLATKLVAEINGKAKSTNHSFTTITKEERAGVYAFIGRFVKSLPDQFFSQASIPKVSFEEFERDNKKISKESKNELLPQTLMKHERAMEERLAHIIDAFMQGVSAKN